MSKHYTEEDWREVYEERAAIMEYDGGLLRKEAERRSAVATRIARLMVTSESMQAREKATAPKWTQQKPQEPIEQQSILPGFEATFTGG